MEGKITVIGCVATGIVRAVALDIA